MAGKSEVDLESTTYYYRHILFISFILLINNNLVFRAIQRIAIRKFPIMEFINNPSLLSIFYLFVTNCSHVEADVCLPDDIASTYSVQHCPPGWVRFKDEKCFKYFTESESQQRAERACEAQGATLASLQSDEEMNFLASYISREIKLGVFSHVWLGGLRKENLWFWSDLSPFGYNNWWPGHPDFRQGFCVYMVTGDNYFKVQSYDWGKMGTIDCSVSFHYMCQKYQKDTRKVIKSGKI